MDSSASRHGATDLALLDGLAGDADTGFAVVDAEEGTLLWANGTALRLLDSRVAIGGPWSIRGDIDGRIELGTGRTVSIDATRGRLGGTETTLYVLAPAVGDAPARTGPMWDEHTRLLSATGLVQRAQRIVGSPATLVLIEVEDPISLYEHHGEGHAEAVVRAIAGRIEHRTRDVDLVARWDRDRFVVLVGTHQVDPLIGRLQDALAPPLHAGGATIPVRTTIAAISATGAWDVDELVGAAVDAARRQRSSRFTGLALTLFVEERDETTRRMVQRITRLGAHDIEVVTRLDDLDRFLAAAVATTPTLEVASGEVTARLVGADDPDEIARFLQTAVCD